MTNKKTEGFACELECGRSGSIWYTLSVWKDQYGQIDFWSFQLYRHDGSGYPILRFGYKIPVGTHSQPGWRPLFWDLEDSRDDAYKLHTLWRELENLAHAMRDLGADHGPRISFVPTPEQKRMAQEIKTVCKDDHEFDCLLYAIREITLMELACVGLDGFSEPFLPPELDPDKIDSCLISHPDLDDGRSTPISLDALPSCFMRDELELDFSFRDFPVKMKQALTLQPNGTYLATFKLVDIGEYIDDVCTITLTLKD